MDPRELVPLGRTGLQVTRLGLGTAPLGGMYTAVGDQDADDALQAAYDLGWRLVDTAPHYGSGLAETRVGRALRRFADPSVVLSTKVGRVLEPVTGRGDDASIFRGAPPLEPRFDFSEAGVRRSFDESLERLGVERIDVALVHDPDDHAEEALAGAFPVLRDLRARDMVGAIGAGMNRTALLTRFVHEADVDVVLVAGRYTLLDQSALDDLLPACGERRVAVMCGGVYNSGVLAAGGTYDYGPASEEVLERTRRIEGVCARYDVPLKAAAIRFPLGHPAVACVVVGARSGAEVAENDAMFRTPVPSELWADLARDGLLRPDAPVPS